MNEPSPELCVVVADADADRLMRALLQRAIDSGCLRRFAWVVIRDPMKDSAVWREPTRALAPYLGVSGRRLLVIWDHEGSGREDDDPADVESDVIVRLTQAGAGPSDISAIALLPEVEAVFEHTWERVVTLIAETRGRAAPSDADVLRRAGVKLRDGEDAAEAARQYSARRPKEYLQAVLKLAGLKHEPSLFEDLGRRLSVPALKRGEASGRIAAVLVRWFGAQERQPCGE